MYVPSLLRDIDCILLTIFYKLRWNVPLTRPSIHRSIYHHHPLQLALQQHHVAVREDHRAKFIRRYWIPPYKFLILLTRKQVIQGRQSDVLVDQRAQSINKRWQRAMQTFVRNKLNWNTLPHVLFDLYSAHLTTNLHFVMIVDFPMEKIWESCDAKHFRDELPVEGKFSTCCPKVHIARSSVFPSFLHDLFTNHHSRLANGFRRHIRSYNSSVSFASMGAKIVSMDGRGPYCFKVHGQISSDIWFAFT